MNVEENDYRKMQLIRKPWFRRSLSVVLLAIIGSMGYLTYRIGWDRPVPTAVLPEEDPIDSEAKRSFDGSSEGLRDTEVVPTLDTPLTQGKSAIWCSSFQIAWNRVKTELAQGPVEVRGAEEIAERLNRAPHSEDDLAAGSYYVAAGKVADGIVDQIGTDLAGKFPNAPRPKGMNLLNEVIVYAYLEANIKFNYRYFNNPAPFLFTDGAGKQTSVRSFGVGAEQKLKKGLFRDQVRVLFRRGGEFALDLSKETQPNQVVVARIARRPTLAAILEDLRAKLAGNSGGTFGIESVLLIPNLDWRIEHHFRELEGPVKFIQNPSLEQYAIGQALQVIQFKLSRSGAQLASAATVDLSEVNGDHDDDPNVYQFDRPFLIYMMKRGANRPFFVLWVDNAELLCKD